MKTVSFEYFALPSYVARPGSLIFLSGMIYLRGNTDYGDAVEDEWFIVFMLREISLSHPSAWIRVSDADGEFLLVEAANVLPSWLSPEMDRHRVWIHNGHLYIIPLETESSVSTPKNMTLRNAVDFIQRNHQLLINSPFIEAEAFYRLEKYPGHLKQSTHHALVRIPRKLAYAIHENAKSLSAAVEAFYLRDAVDLKRITSASGPLTFQPNDMVTVSVRFSKILFAQLRSQRFEPPVRWQETVGQALQESSSDKERAKVEDGMKLTCGYEILSSNAENHKSRSVRELALTLADIEEDGGEGLPSNEEIDGWPDVKLQDDESWMDINYEDFERELDGKATKHANDPGKSSGFGDARTQEDLKKIVSRFEAFLNDDNAGLDGAQLDEMDNDDDDDDASDNELDTDSEDQEISFDEAEFSRMMREMMGLPGGPAATQTAGAEKPVSGREPVDIQQLSTQMEAELKQEGALKIDPVQSSHRTLKSAQEKAHSSTSQTTTNDDHHQDNDNKSDESDGEVDIDYNLARNLLESFKSQAGMSGPTGNLLGLMGFQLPRDEDDNKNGSGNQR